jgi:short-subunit dehydrogenase
LFTFVADLAKKQDVDAFGSFALSFNKPISVLVNNAGVFLPGTIGEEPEGAFETQWQTNVASAYYLTRVLLPNMKQVGTGHIFNICSTASIVAYPNGGSYCISKFALLGFSKVLREELKHFGIRVTSILPGATLTDSWAGTNLPENRFMAAEDVAQMVLACYNVAPNTVVEELLMRPLLGDIS